MPIEKVVLHGKFGDWEKEIIEGEHPTLELTGPLGLLKTVETIEGVCGS